MGYQQLVGAYINALNIESAQQIAAKYGVTFDKEETKIILNFLKSHKYELDLEHKNSLLEEGSKFINKSTLMKVNTLLNKFIK